MGTVKSSLVLHDGMSAALRRINNAMNIMLSNFEAAQRASGKAVDTTELAAARREMNLANNALDQMEQNYRDCNDQQSELNRRISTGASQAEGLMSKIKSAAGAYTVVKAAGELVGLSDTMAGNATRLSMIVDDGGSVEELQQKIYNSAQSARGAYTDTMATVAKLGQTAGDAFSNNDQLIKFTELVNKNFVVGGASATEQASAMYQLTQAMSSGRLQGDEYRSIIENAPLLAKSIEDYMRNVQGAVGSMKDWASEGLLTADVIKSAVFNSAGEVEERFSQMPMMWAQVWTDMKNRAVVALQPLLLKINEFANNPRVQDFLDGLVSGFSALANIAGMSIDFIVGAFFWLQDTVSPITDWFASAAQGICDSWSYVAPILSGVISAVAVLASLFLVYKVVLAIATAAQWLYNLSLYSCPLVWILGIIILVILAIYGVVQAINAATGSTISATGVIMGSLATLGAFIWDLVLGCLELVFGAINALTSPFAEIANFIGNVFTNPISSIIYLFQGLADTVLGILQSIASALDFVFGSDMAGTVQGWRDGLKSKADEMVAEYAPDENYTKIIEGTSLSVEGLGLKRIAYSDAWSSGYELGEGIDKGLAEFDPNSLFKNDQTVMDAYDGSTGLDISDTLAGISADTSDIAGSVDKSSEELAYLRDIAEREAINRFTTAEVRVDMTGMTNRIDGQMDIDGVISYLSDNLVDALSTAAEGVY